MRRPVPKRFAKEAGGGGVEVASIGMGHVKAEELNSPLSQGAGVSGGTLRNGWGMYLGLIYIVTLSSFFHLRHLGEKS
jgi:hypothetical protein